MDSGIRFTLDSIDSAKVRTPIAIIILFWNKILIFEMENKYKKEMLIASNSDYNHPKHLILNYNRNTNQRYY
jgi:hypothetical protein